MMKRIIVLLTLIVMCTTTWAQQADNAAFFAGKWNVTVTATPMGDVTLLMNLEMKEGKLTGNISDPATGNEVAEIYSIEVRENSITVSFNAEGYDVFPVSYTHLRAHETVLDLVCRLLLEKKKKKK